MPFTFSGSSVDRLDHFFTVETFLPLNTHMVDQFAWIAPFHATFRGVRFVAVTTSSQAGATVTPRKITDAAAPGAAASATVIELTAAIPTDGTDLVAETPALAGTGHHFKPGDRYALDFSATQTALAGVLIVTVFEKQ